MSESEAITRPNESTLSMLDVIRGRRYHGMSDAQRDNEYGCQARLAKAIYEMEQAIKMVNAESAVERIRVSAWTDFLHDEIPDTASWDAKIEAARNT